MQLHVFAVKGHLISWFPGYWEDNNCIIIYYNNVYFVKLKDLNEVILHVLYIHPVKNSFIYIRVVRSRKVEESRVPKKISTFDKQTDKFSYITGLSLGLI